MAQYKIQFTFTANPLTGSEVSITAGAENFLFSFASNATDPGQVNIGTTLYDTMQNMIVAFNARYNLQGKYTVTRGANQWEFKGEFSEEPVVDYNDTNGNIVILITTATPALTINSLEFDSNASNTCGLIDIIITTNLPIKKLNKPYVDETFSGTTNRITNIARGAFTTIEVVGLDDKVYSISSITPSYLIPLYIQLSISYGNVIISAFINNLTLEYSLNNIDWQSENSFNNLFNGDYTLYIRDQFGCNINMQFSITAAGDGGEIGTGIEVSPYFFYSKANSIRMAKREEINNIDINKNPENSLSCEEDFDYLIWKQKQVFRSTDVVVIQYKSNIDGVEIKTSDSDVALPVVQKSANMNIKEAMDAIAKSVGQNEVGIYFIAGQMYNYDTLELIGEQYELAGSVPSWGIPEHIITIGGLNYPILRIEYDENLRVNMLIINSAISDGNVIVKTVYNAVDYDVFEATIPMLGKTKFNVSIFFDGTKQYESELIEIDDTTNRLALIQSSMSYNTDMMYSTGIIPFFRLPYDMIKLGTNRENDKYNTDDTYIQIDAKRFDVDVYKFLPVTRSMARVMDVIFSNDTININGINYITDSFSIEPLGESNLYSCEATMLVASSGLYKDNKLLGNVVISDLIQTETDGFIKI